MHLITPSRGIITPAALAKKRRTNILPNADNHSAWNGPTGWASGTTDIRGGTTAETYTEHSGSGSRSCYTNGFSTTTGQHLMEFCYKQKAGSNSARKLVIEAFDGPSSWSRGIDLDLDELGNAGVGTWGTGITHDSVTVTTGQDGWFSVRWKFTFNFTTMGVWIGHWNDSGGTYTGDGVSGWIIDQQRVYKL